MQDLSKLKIPDGWIIETIDGRSNQVLLTTPSPNRYMATIDFTLRGFRTGMSCAGPLHGDRLKQRKLEAYSGRGWTQRLVDDVVTHLRSI